MNLPYDIARCNPAKCDVKSTCARFTCKGDPSGYQTMFDGSIDNQTPCDMFIENHLDDMNVADIEGVAT